MKDQFIFGIHNKEIQDHLLGEIKETDNSVRALYEARKIDSKLAQRQMLGIVNPDLVSVDAFRSTKKKYMTVSSVDIPMERVIVQLLAKNAISVVVRTTLGKCVDLARDLTSLSQDVTQEGQVKPMESADINAEYMK